MTLDGMNAYLEDKGFDVHRERDSKRGLYIFTISKPGYESLSKEFKYPDSNNWDYKDAKMRDFLNGMVRDFYYKGEKKEDMDTLKFEHPVFQTRGDAENALRLLRNTIRDYGFVTVSDWYDSTGMIAGPNDSKYGWTNLEKVEVTRTRDGYILTLPDPTELNQKRVKSSVSYRDYARRDVESTNRTYRYVSRTPHFGRLPAIENVIFSDPATIVFWADGTKTVVKCQEEYTFDPMAGMAMAICEKAFGSKANSHKVFNKWLPKEEKDVPMLYPEIKFDDTQLAQAVEKAKVSFTEFIDDLFAKKRGREEV